jgi:hypothetical protein
VIVIVIVPDRIVVVIPPWTAPVIMGTRIPEIIVVQVIWIGTSIFSFIINLIFDYLLFDDTFFCW